jgi:hypothetical protein
MRQSTAVMIFLGLASTACLMVLLLVGMGHYAEDAGGARTKLSFDLKQKYKFAAASVEAGAGGPELVVRYEVRENGAEPETANARELEARRLYSWGKNLDAQMKGSEAEQYFIQLRERYRETEAYAQYEMWDVATTALRLYGGQDREKLERIRVIRRMVYVHDGFESERLRTLEPPLELPKAQKPK